MSGKQTLLKLLTAAAVCMNGCDKKGDPESPGIHYVKKEMAKLAHVELECDISRLSKEDKACLGTLLEAAKVIDRLFLLQVNPGNPEILSALERPANPADTLYREFFSIMFGPWNRIDKNKPFIGTAPKPAGAGYYPPDMTKEEFESFLSKNPDKAEDFKSAFTIIGRKNGTLEAIPYRTAYRPLVQKINTLLKKAAEETRDPTLKNYLSLRADDFLTDDYFKSDMAWLDLAGDLEIVIGPYEVYEDNLFNYKAAYEAFLCVVDHAESEKLSTAANYLKEMEAALPIPDKYKNNNRGLTSPIKVVQEVFSAGDTKAGIQTTAFNLPNDERVREAKGSKKVMVKNIARAKYEKCWIPIVNKILAPKPLAGVTFDSYFNHVLMHEISHGLGPGLITLPNGKKEGVDKALKECYTMIEECKADVLGILNMKFLMDKGVFRPEDEYSMYASYLGGMLRSVRFGIEEAHGGGVAIQFNYCFERGAFITDRNGKLDLDAKKILPALRELATEVLLIQAEGDYERAGRLIDKYRGMTPVLQGCVDMLKDEPIDIRPVYPVESTR